MSEETKRNEPVEGADGFDKWFDEEYPQLASIVGIDMEKSLRNVGRNSWRAARAYTEAQLAEVKKERLA